MNRMKRPESWQGVLIVSPLQIKGIPTLPKARTNGFYKTVQAFDSVQALSIIENDLPAIIVADAFMDGRPHSIHKSLNLIEQARSKEFNALIVATSTVPLDHVRLDNIIGGGANMYLHAENLGRELPKVVENYETIMLCNKEYMERHPELTSEVRKATFYINQQYLKTYFKRNPGVKKIKIDPWRINRLEEENKQKPDDCCPGSYCFEFLRSEVA